MSMVGALTLCFLLLFTTSSRGDEAERRKPSPTLIGGTPWTPKPADDGPKVVYGTDDRIDVYAETDPDRLTWAASTCGLMSQSSLQEGVDGSFTIRTSNYDVCEEEPFSDQPTAMSCTGFMVGEDLIATAGHCYDAGDLSGTRFVFGFVMEDANTPVLTVSADQVYRGIELVGQANSGGLDYAIIRVDRPIVAPGAVAFDIQREGVIEVGAPVGVIGHPAGLPLKLAFGDNTAVRSNDETGYFVANLDTYGGNSGSPVIDPLTGVVEGILVRGETDFVTVGNCSMSNVVSNSGGRGEDVSKTTTFMQYVPVVAIRADGALSLDQRRYACDGVMSISLMDGDLADLATAMVQLVTSGGDSETISLAAQPTRGLFSGTMTLQSGEPAVDNGSLEVAEDDIITTSYADASHSPEAPDLVVAEALVDCTAPVVTNVSITSVGAQFATVQFDSSEAVRGTVRAGLTCGSIDAQATFALATTHSILVQELLPLSAYFVMIEAVDEAGNVVVVDNEGLCFPFETEARAEYYTEVFASRPSDLANSSILFSPRENGDGYTLCTEAISALPVASTGATTLTLLDDGSAEVSLGGGATFPFYGSVYERVFVNANGNVTFDAGDDTSAPQSEDHFEMPRVAPCFTDLNPTKGGMVWHIQLDDRLVITWAAVPRYGSADTNTIQLELYFDGTIQFSYLALSNFNSIAGLSSGVGVASDFTSTDLSGQAACGSSTGRYHSADTDQNHAISLQEVLRVIQFMNLGGYHCDANSQDGFAPGLGTETCASHDIDYNPQDWAVSAAEVNRLIQFYNAGGYGHNPAEGTEDGFFPILVP